MACKLCPALSSDCSPARKQSWTGRTLSPVVLRETTPMSPTWVGVEPVISLSLVFTTPAFHSALWPNNQPNSSARRLPDAGPERARDHQIPRGGYCRSAPRQVLARSAGPAPSPARDPAGLNHPQAGGGQECQRPARVSGAASPCRWSGCAERHCAALRPPTLAKGPSPTATRASRLRLLPHGEAQMVPAAERSHSTGVTSRLTFRKSERIRQPMPQSLQKRKGSRRNFLLTL